jgi:hypothetical protein
VRENGDEPCGGDGIKGVIRRQIHLCGLLLPLESVRSFLRRIGVISGQCLTIEGFGTGGNYKGSLK